jgi:glycosyltransferase involved in cell wall biosynthesis
LKALNNLKVSIIIPTFNRSGLLVEAIESSLKQDYQNFEVIISDNASTDNTPSVVKKYTGDVRVKYFRNNENIGMIGNWRKCIYEYISGDFFILISDDDYFIKDDYLSKAMELVQESPELVMVFANRTTYYENLNKRETTLNCFEKVVNGTDLFFKYANKNLGFHLVTTLFKTDIARSIGMFSQDGLLSSDVLEFLRFCLRGKVGFFSDVVAVYRKHPLNAWDNLGPEELIYNSGFIEKAYEDAITQNGSNHELLDKWRHSFLANYLRLCVYYESDKKGGFLKVWNFVVAVLKKMPRFSYIFIHPKTVYIVAKKLCKPFLLSILNNFRQYQDR